jgi:hypothetical protein
MVRHQAKAYGAKPTCDRAVVLKCPKCKALSQSRRTYLRTSTLVDSRVIRFSVSAAEVLLVEL